MSSIAAGTTSGTALVSTGDTTGLLVLKTGSSATTAVTINTTQNVGIGVTPSTGTGWVSNLELLSTSNIVNQGTDFSLGSNWYYNSGYKYKSTGAVANIYLKNGTVQFQYAASGTADGAFSLLESARIDNSGNVLIGVTSANANGGVLQLKSGITFPATQVASSDVNTLDDYEEGTWTPTFSPAGGSVTHSTRQGNYVKVGSMVLANFFIQISSASSPSGGLSITGFPFQTLGSSYGNPGAGLTSAGNWSTQTPERIQAGGANTTGFNLLYRTSITGSLDNSITLASSLQANTYVYGSVVYQTT
jgi:hypothetical protein